MAYQLTDTLVKQLPAPKSGNRITYDEKVRGFGVRVTAAGTRAFVLNYRTRAGRERRFTIGAWPDWKVAPARNEAAELKKRIDRGEDPMGEVQAERDAPSMVQLAERFETEYLPRKRVSTRRDYKGIIAGEILPAMRSLKVAEVTFSDCDGLHQKITKRGAPYRANRTLAVLSKMFSQAIKWRYRADNPVKGVERNTEYRRERYLSADEIKRLSVNLAKHQDQQAANIIRLMLLTGARIGELRTARWDQLDLEKGTWTKPGAATKQDAVHRAPLSAPARQLLMDVRTGAEKAAKKTGEPMSEYVFPGRGGVPRNYKSVKGVWDEISEAAKLSAHTRPHDLRHTFASHIVNTGGTLPLIGALLGHTQAATTQRYAHLFDDPLRQAAERVGAIVVPQDEGGNV